MTEAATLLKLIGNKSHVTMELGYYRGPAYPRVQIDVGGGLIPAEVATSYMPEINEAVHVLFVDGKPYMLGPAVPKPAWGVIVTVASGLATVSTDAGNLVGVPYPFGSTLSSGEQVKLYWAEGPYILSKMSTSPTPPPPDPSGGGATPQTRQQVFTAIQSGSWQINGSRWIDDEPRASLGYYGAWHYGTKIADTIPAAAYNGGVEMFTRFSSRSGNAPNFALHNQATRGGAPALSGDVAWAPADGWNRLPESVQVLYFNSLKAGGGAFGIGLNHGGQNRFMGIGSDPQSGALRITYTV